MAFQIGAIVITMSFYLFVIVINIRKTIIFFRNSEMNALEFLDIFEEMFSYMHILTTRVTNFKI